MIWGVEASRRRIRRCLPTHPSPSPDCFHGTDEMATRCYFIRLRYVGQEAGDVLHFVPAGLTHPQDTILSCTLFNELPSGFSYHKWYHISLCCGGGTESRLSTLSRPLPSLFLVFLAALARGSLLRRRTDESSRAGSAFTMALELQAYLALYKLGL